MERTLTLVALIGLGWGLVGCGDKDDDSGTPVDEDDGSDPADDTSEPLEERQDLDHDGYWDDEDCDDNNYAVYPGAEELCDGVDNNCDEVVDEGFDSDGDGENSAADCEDGTDCDDTDASIGAEAEETPYDDIDQDCDGEDLVDVDGDGFTGEDGGGNDCDDDDDSVYPGADEIAKDGIDQDCDGDDNYDGDGDGHEDEPYGEDCDDEDAFVYPEAWDWYNDGLDANCDGADDTQRDLADANHTISMSGADNARFGAGIAVCDFDEDGVDDLFVASSEYGEWAGRINGFYGREAWAWKDDMDDTEADLDITSEDNLMGFGVHCADVDGDGHMDLIAHRAAFYNDVAESLFIYINDPGLVIWYGDGSQWTGSMSDADADAELTVELDMSDGQSIFSFDTEVGDLDADGAAELLIAMEPDDDYYPDASYAIYIAPGAAYSGDVSFDAVAVAMLSHDEDGTVSDIDIVDDFSGDGYAELIVHQPFMTFDNSYDGRLSVISGLPSGSSSISSYATADIDGNSGYYFGYRSGYGDFDGDGTTDAAVSAPTDATYGTADAGALYVYMDVGSAWNSLGLSAEDTLDESTTGRTESGQLGLRVFGVGDIDGDGTDDAMVLEPYGGDRQEGELHLFGGHLMDGTQIAPGEYEIMSWDFESGNGVSLTGRDVEVGDLDGDGYNDMVISAQYEGTQASGAQLGKVYLILSSDLPR